MVGSFWVFFAPAALWNWLGMAPSAVATIGLVGGLAWLAYNRTWPALVAFCALAVLACSGAAGLGAAVMLLAAADGRVSPLGLLALAGLAGGLSSAPLLVAGATLGLGVLASVSAGAWRCYGPDLDLSLSLPRLDATLVLLFALGVGALALACVGLVTLARSTQDIFSRPIPGSVVFSQAVAPADTEATSSYWLDVRYQYPGGEGTTRVGEVSRDEQAAKDWVAAHPPGTPVIVWVRPGSSTLWHEVSPEALLMIWLGGLLGWIPLVGCGAGSERAWWLVAWWTVSLVLSAPLIALVGNIGPLYLVAGMLAAWSASYKVGVTDTSF